MRRLMLTVAAAVAAHSAFAAFGDTLAIASGQTVTVDESVSYDALEIHGTLVVQSPVNTTPTKLTLADNTSSSVAVNLGPSLGDVAALTIDSANASGTEVATATPGKAAPWWVGNPASTNGRRSGGWGKIDVEGGAFRSGEFYISYYAAPPLSGDNTVVSLGRGVLPSAWNPGIWRLRRIVMYCPNPVTIKFNGGYIQSAEASGLFFFRTTSSTGDITLESVNGMPIAFSGGGHTMRYLFSGDGNSKLITKGSGDLLLMSSGANEVLALGGSASSTDGKVEYGHAGDTEIRGGTVRTYQANLLPGTADTGFVKVTSDKGVLDLYGTSQAVNGLVVSGGGTVANTSETAAKIVLGTHKDGVLEAAIPSGVSVEQVGNTVCVSNTTVGTYTLSSGTAAFHDTTFANLVAASGTRVVADGCILELTAGNFTDNGATFSAVNGGSVVYGGRVYFQSGGTVEASALGDISSLTLVNDAAGTTLIDEKTALACGGIHVASGTLAFANDVSKNAWWKIIFKETSTPGRHLSVNGLMFSDVADVLLDASAYAHNVTRYNNVTMQVAAHGTAAADMPAGSVTCPADYLLYEYSGTQVAGDLNYMFNNWNPSATGSGDANYVCVTNRSPVASDPSSWVEFTVRMPASVSTVAGYSVKQCWSSTDTAPASWELQTSHDGVTWFKADEKTRVPRPDEFWSESPLVTLDMLKSSYFGVNPNVHGAGEALTPLSEDDSAENQAAYRAKLAQRPGWYGGGDYQFIKPYSVGTARTVENAGFVPGALLQVDAGAVLDLTHSAASGSVVSRLRVDRAVGGGTIAGATVARGGVLDIVNGGESAAEFRVLAFEGLDEASISAFRTWNVTVDGVASALRLTFRNGELWCGLPKGTVFTVR